MADVTFVQRAIGQSGSSTTTVTLTFGAAPTAGNILVFAMGGDKNTGALTLAGWTPLFALTQASVSLYVSWKISDGTETSISPSWQTTSAAGNMAWMGEYSCADAGTWQIAGSASTTSDNTSVNSQTTNTTSATTAAGMGLAFAAIDSSQSRTSGGTWTNSYTNRYDGSGGSGRGAIWVAEHLEAAAATASSTFSYVGTADQMSAAIAVIAKVAAGPTPKTLSDTGAGTDTWAVGKDDTEQSIDVSTSGTATDKLTVSIATPIRAAFYYSWFIGGSPTYPGSWSQAGVEPWTQYHPVRGYYDQANTSVIDAQIAEMLYGKFSAGIATWWGQGAATDSQFQILLTRANTLGTGFRWVIYYEAEGNIIGGATGSPNPTAAQITSDLNYITANYTNHPNYLHVGGKPVIFAFGDPSDDDTITTDILQRPAKRWKDATTSADEPWYYVLKVYAGYTTDHATYPASSWHQYGPAAATDQQNGYSYTISPGFWLATETTPRLTRDPNAFSGNVRDMLAATADWKLVTSYNEWGEGHPVEAADSGSGRNYTGPGWTSLSGYGTYLDILAADGIADTSAKTLSDSGTATDSAVTNVAATANDTGTASTTINVSVAVPTLDTAAATTITTVTATATLTDAGVATDSIQLAVTPLLPNTGLASDNIAPSAAIKLSDTATSADNLTTAAACQTTPTAITATSTVPPTTIQTGTALTDNAAALDQILTALVITLADTAAGIDGE